MSKKLIGPFKQIITMEELPIHGTLFDNQMKIIQDGGILIDVGKISKLDLFEKLKKQAILNNIEIELIKEEQVALPGFIDSHTHICFAGSRAKDYGMRLEGKTYIEIAKAGGGIASTMEHTRKATLENLIDLTSARANILLKQGITTIEIKSGYGLTVEQELKLLRAINQVKHKTRADIVPTCLAAHMKPKDFIGTSKQYLTMILDKLIPSIKEENLTNRMDIFVENVAFDLEQSYYYLTKVKDLGFDITVHADQFTIGGSKLAVDFSAVSADHLEAITNEEINLFKNSNCVAVALPGASLGLAMPFTPARKLLDKGACLSIASDWNPGSAPMGKLLLQACLLGVEQKLTITETLAGLTFRAAKALNLNDRGILKKGNLADIVAFPTNDFKEIVYHQGGLEPSAIWKEGILIN